MTMEGLITCGTPKPNNTARYILKPLITISKWTDVRGLGLVVGWNRSVWGKTGHARLVCIRGETQVLDFPHVKTAMHLKMKNWNISWPRKHSLPSILAVSFAAIIFSWHELPAKYWLELACLKRQSGDYFWESFGMNLKVKMLSYR